MSGETDKDLNEARLAAALEQSCSGADASPGELAAIRAKLAQAGVSAAAPTPSTTKELEPMSNAKPATPNVFAPRERESAFGLGGWITVAACLAAALLLAAGAGVFRKTPAPEAMQSVPPESPETAKGIEDIQGKEREMPAGPKEDAPKRSIGTAVDDALNWLAKANEPDGHFNSAKYGGLESQDVAVTALAHLSWLGQGHTPRTGRYKAEASAACEWLARQNPTDNTQAALRALALGETCGMTGGQFKDEAQAAIDLLTGRQCADGGWELEVNGNRKMGTVEPTVWTVMAVKSARVSGLKVKGEVFEGAARALASYTDDSQRTTQAEYLAAAAANNFIESSGVAIGALAAANRSMLIGDENEIYKLLKMGMTPGAKAAAAPLWPKDGLGDEIVDWYRGTLVHFKAGGAAWKAYNTALLEALLPHQSAEGDDAGSWPVSDSPGFKWGRAGATALASLSLEVYFRYLPMYQKEAKQDESKSQPAERENF